MAESTAGEQRILAKISRRTRHEFSSLGWIPESKRSSIGDVLEVVREELDTGVDEDALRGGLYRCFGLPRARPFLPDILRWWRAETQEDCLDDICHVLRKLATESRARQIWETCQAAASSPGQCSLVVLLAKFPSVRDEVVTKILRDLDAGSLRPYEMRAVSRMRDARIRARLDLAAHSEHKDARRTNRRVAGKFIAATSAVDYARELFSTQIGVADLDDLRDLALQATGLTVPAGLLSEKLLRTLPIDRWYHAASTESGLAAEVWIRLEDVDVLEVVLSRPSKGG